MAKDKTKFICQECGYESLRWLGRCPGCGRFNTLVEEIISSDAHPLHLSAFSLDKPRKILEIKTEKEERLVIPLLEFNRVLGGGIIPGSLVLIGGDPGIGKSTLLLQVSCLVEKIFGLTLYISGEESPQQVKLRAKRLNISADNLYLVSETNIETIEKYALELKPHLLIIDSIQTVFYEALSAAPGSVSQVRECTNRLMHLAKRENIPAFIIGHVTKDGAIAGPRVLEHIVDTVLYLEGEKYSNFRILRAIKNRFGPTSEIGVFEMQDRGLEEVANPSKTFLAERAGDVSGSVIISSLEGTRPILLELQALVSFSGFGIPRRMTTGLDYNRISLILAVLEKKVGLNFSNQDVYVNLAGGVKVEEPAADLGAAVAIASSFKDIPAKESMIILGEVGLAGEVRAISQLGKRLNESSRLGFKRCILPWTNLSALPKVEGIEVIGVKTVKEAVSIALKEMKDG